MFQKVISAKGFWRSVITSSFWVFIVIYNLIDMWFGYDFDFSLFVEKRFSKDNLLRFFVANIMSGFVYGFVVTFLKFRGQIKKNESQ